eukprot:Blabericola_migrator_1__1387@NODE_135_length_13182_cov_103_341289_g117_i0_p5_GENE_NODE_135_length_13182_cov_103_341289_g117_i0NODE_135_length_13182_cov_103_341289_g117_i0_p5_ORF_typecomplete_len226_score17_92_NODE_135_length_13182_cov_103_341289_g117_i028683545
MRGVLLGHGNKTDHKYVLRALLAVCDLWFHMEDGGRLILKCEPGEKFVFFGMHPTRLEGTLGNYPKVIVFIPGSRHGVDCPRTEQLRYGFLFAVTAKDKQFDVWTINLQKLGRYILKYQHLLRPQALLAIPKFAAYDFWPFDGETWTEFLRRFLSAVVLNGRSTRLFNGQSIALNLSTLTKWARKTKPIGAGYDPPPHNMLPMVKSGFPSIRFIHDNLLRGHSAY